MGSLNTAARSGRLDSEALEEDDAADAELDTLDEGLHAFQEPLYSTASHQTQAAVLPAHDGLGSFQASAPPVLEQLWQHEQYNPKRKHEGGHRRTSSVQRRLDNLEDLETQANEEKRIRIEKWRLEQSQAMLEEVERETRRQIRRQSVQQTGSLGAAEDILGSTPKQSDYLPTVQAKDESEPFWRRITRTFIRDIIGIDEPLLSVILGESLPEEALEPKKPAPSLPTIPEQSTPEEVEDQSWRDRLLQRIARELGVLVHQISPHPGAFSTYTPQQTHDYAGMPVTIPIPQKSIQSSQNIQVASALTPNFPPTFLDSKQAEIWGFEEEPPASSSASLNLQREREYWERELDVKMVFRYLRDKFVQSSPESASAHKSTEDTARRTAIIRQHHPLVARAHRPPARMRRDSRLSVRRPTSSCASESVKSSRKSLVKSGSSRNYWDIGGSIGSGSVLASGGLMGAWGEV